MVERAGNRRRDRMIPILRMWSLRAKSVSPWMLNYKIRNKMKNPRSSPIGAGGEEVLSAERIPLRHYLTHLPKHPNCKACQTAKMQNRQCRRAPEDKDRDLERFGDVITADHIVTFGSEKICHEGYQNAVVMKDLHTGWIECYPVALKS